MDFLKHWDLSAVDNTCILMGMAVVVSGADDRLIISSSEGSFTQKKGIVKAEGLDN
jgi:hypothetical protein